MMKLLILLSSLCTAFCSDNIQINNNERRLAGAGNYGGFIGLVTYPAGPFLVDGIHEKKEVLSNKNNYEYVKDDEKYDPKYMPNLGLEDTLQDQIYYFKTNKNYIKSLGNHGEYEHCVGKYGERPYLQSNIEDEKRSCDILYGYTGPTANDEPANIIRPCALDDWQCIRKFFAANGKCKPVHGPVPDPMYIDLNTVFNPSVNVTGVLPNLKIKGFSSAKVREFYLNKKSGNLVFEIEVTNLNESTPRGYVRFHRTAKESIVLADYASVEIDAMAITAVIPNAPDLRLDLADIHGDIRDNVPKFKFGPGIYNSTDPDVIQALADIQRFNQVFARETIVFQIKLLTAIYIQENICDFGLKIISIS